ncbi:MAG: hypothetical protein HYT40_03060 [Candidatus Sungbacteria bacterium]|uniref:Uncharacterized protein n=1 Tax=Candidatus Sungiibacteriota bacterium TaxID=2750080 RepID=A0A931SBZ3_9BACT|nr:hypothetical protein [Candidatus Sungbacteria bacterium]
MIIIFAAIFFLSVIGAAVIITKKIPLILATPREVVSDYFERGSSRMHVRILRLRGWIQQGAYWDPLLAFTARFLRSLRVVLLRLDQYSFNLLQSIKEKSERRKIFQTPENDPKYWEGLKAKKPKEETSNVEPHN